MFPKKVVAALCAAVLSLAMPTMAFANGVGPSGWNDGAGVSGIDSNGNPYEVHAWYINEADDVVPISIALGGGAPSNWPGSASNFLGSFITLSADAYVEGQPVYVYFDFDESYDSSNRSEPVNLTFYVEHDDGSTNTYSGFVGDTQYGTTGFTMDKLSRIGVTGTVAGSGSAGSGTSDGSATSGSQGSDASSGALSPKTGIDLDGQLFAVAVCGIVAAGIAIIGVRRIARVK